ncbi:precorrin-4 C(11)-methyltransferase [Methanocella conradii]|uniref:precorrin-4 C(11)-methyltransferase n=1 Tax=Methanocella conradii TaxID=1175444 RepID=UPI00157CBF29|nr:precorrin-4 C(11)-methyltransferase [Methanocella conradii]
MKVYFVGAGPGDPGLITVRGLELIKRADVLIYAGSLVNPALVEASPAGVKLDSHGMRLEGIVEAMVSGAREGKLVVRLHSGDPSLYGAIVEQIAELKKAGVEAEVVPGVSSMFAAAAALQTQLALRGVSETVIVTRPAGATLEKDDIAALSAHGATMVVFLGAEKVEDVMRRVEYPADTPAAVIYHASWPDQKVIRGTVSDIADMAKKEGIERTALIIIGDVVEGKCDGRSALYS